MTKQYSFFYRNSLSIVFMALFLLAWAGQAITGWYEHNNMLAEQGANTINFFGYLASGHFIQATFENWESEFLQMFLYVVLTVKLRQWGSSESKPIGKSHETDREPVAGGNAPWPVKKGGFALTLYKNSLSIAFLVLFLISWALHAYGSYKDYIIEETLNGQPVKDFVAFLGEPRFWFEAFQNWQSEFLAVAAIVVLSIFLRQHGSPESKPVDASHEKTA